MGWYSSCQQRLGADLVPSRDSSGRNCLLDHCNESHGSLLGTASHIQSGPLWLRLCSRVATPLRVQHSIHVEAMPLPWFRVHAIVLNDPGRLLSVHIMHTGLVSGWAGSMIFYEIAAFDPNDIVFNPMWRQGCFVLPFATRLGVVDSWSGWSMLGSISDRGTGWSYEAVGTSHIILAGLCFAASAWHWTYWDLDVFRDRRSNELCLDLPQIFGIHLLLSGLLCLSFGAFHCAVYPGIWVSDVFGLSGAPTAVSYVWGPQGFDAFNPGGIASHHVAAGSIGVLGGIFHLTCRPSYALYTVLRIGNIETVLASSTAAVSWAALVASGTMWYGSASNPTECFGPTRYMWDLGLYLEATETVVQRECAGNAPAR